MTLVEFIHPLRKGKQREVALCVLYYFKRYKQRPAMTASEIKAAWRNARVQGAARWNVNAIVNTAAPYVQQEGSTENGALLFKITGTGEDCVRELLGLPAAEPEVEHDVTSLSSLAAGVTDDAVRGYIEESIKSLQVGALRAAIVFLWTGAVATLREEIWSKSNPRTIETELQRHRQNAKFNKKDDFAYVKDVDLLQLGLDLGVIDKTEKQTLGHALDLRNGCGHPTKYSPGVNKTSSFIEDVMSIVFT